MWIAKDRRQEIEREPKREPKRDRKQEFARGLFISVFLNKSDKMY